ncbi:uncharacterized protein E5676_scaffold584G00070 [Cucumis melo var. makuwa]|uniref:DUF1985 domain-containing protein n=1 Tax=Cucumis melo var. makuwa TaxID=1194695 RepID=A0A5D3DG30_CUCMM|nr:uncharacterized protein E5676_scaffold584G00070 [Cucumis melo var. makuwa]
MSKKNEGKQKKKDNVPIAKRKLFESVFKGKGKKIESENVSKKRKFEKDVKARKQKKMKKVIRKKRKFEATTGLNCGPLPTIDILKVKDKFLSKYFKNEDPISRFRVSFLFNELKILKKEDKIKITKIYFLENFLLGKQFTTGYDLEHIKLIDDEKQFDAFPWGRIVWVYECIPLLIEPSIFCVQKVDDNKICILKWVVDSHPEWKELAEMVFDNYQFQYQVMFQNDFVERSMFHETEMRDETHVTFERGECSRQPEPPNEKIAYYFLKFQELIMANNECLNQKLDNLIKEAECLKNIFKDKVTEIVENNENIQKDDNNDGGEGDTNNENVDNEVDRDVTTQQGGQNDLLDDVVYNTALLNEIDKIEKKAIKMKAYQQVVRKSMRRGNLPSRILRSPYTTKLTLQSQRRKK